MFINFLKRTLKDINRVIEYAYEEMVVKPSFERNSLMSYEAFKILQHPIDRVTYRNAQSELRHSNKQAVKIYLQHNKTIFTLCTPYATKEDIEKASLYYKI